MTEIVAVVLPPEGDCAAVARMVAGVGGRFRVVVVGPGASHAFLVRLFGEERPDIIHSFGRGPFGLGR